MQRTRLVDLSLYYYIKDSILVQNGYIYNRAGAILTQDVNDQLKYVSDINNWVYVDLVSYPVVVYDGGVVVDASNYTINFVDGNITFSGYTPTGIVTADYSYDIYKMQVEWTDDIFDRNDLPFILIESMPDYTEGFQIGGGKRQVLSYRIQVFDLSDPESKDITDLLDDYLDHYLPIINYNDGMPLNFDGSKNTSFSNVTQFQSNAESSTGSSTFIRTPTPTEKEEHRRQIMIDVDNYVYPTRYKV